MMTSATGCNWLRSWIKSSDILTGHIEAKALRIPGSSVCGVALSCLPSWIVAYLYASISATVVEALMDDDSSRRRSKFSNILSFSSLESWWAATVWIFALYSSATKDPRGPDVILALAWFNIAWQPRRQMTQSDRSLFPVNLGGKNSRTWKDAKCGTIRRGENPKT